MRTASDSQYDVINIPEEKRKSAKEVRSTLLTYAELTAKIGSEIEKFQMVTFYAKIFILVQFFFLEKPFSLAEDINSLLSTSMDMVSVEIIQITEIRKLVIPQWSEIIFKLVTDRKGQLRSFFLSVHQHHKGLRSSWWCEINLKNMI